MENEIGNAVCSDCGHIFRLKSLDGGFDPQLCPNCQQEIDRVTIPEDGSRKIAWVKE